ncbi:MAG: hypothetical protein J5878_05870 [Oscillospiraceae bacterium]|nr:hypothetical protein [Oscillospiraceae bacterium]
MKRLNNCLYKLDSYQKFILIGSLLMVMIYTVCYLSANAREGYLYNGNFLVHSKENGADVYALRSSSFTQKFTVYAEDKVVMYQYGHKTFGPYTNPASDKSSASLSYPQLDFRIKGGVLRDENGNVIWDDVNGTDDWDAPTRQAIIDVATGKNIVHLGNWSCWGIAAALCLVNVLLVYAAAISRKPGHEPISARKLDVLYGRQLVYFIGAIIRFQKGLHLP